MIFWAATDVFSSSRNSQAKEVTVTFAEFWSWTFKLSNIWLFTCDNISSYTGFWMHEIRQRIWSNGTAWRLGGCYNSARSPPSSHDLVLLPNHKPSCVPPHQKQNKYGFYMSCLWKKVVTRRSDLSLLICVIKVLKKSNHLRGNTAKMMLAWSKAWPYGDQFPGGHKKLPEYNPL